MFLKRIKKKRKNGIKNKRKTWTFRWLRLRLILSTKPHDPSSILRTHMVGGKN